VIAVEPNSEVHSRLVAAVGANGLLERVVTIRAAVGASPGRGRMVVPGKLSVLGFVDTSVPSTSSSDVDVVTIDGLVAQRSLERIDLLKIDVEGAECEVLRGSSRALQRVQRVLLEYHSDGLLAESLSLLRAAGIVELLRVESPKPGIGILYAARPVDA
jgi:FkbM family methyltransferase